MHIRVTCRNKILQQSSKHARNMWFVAIVLAAVVQHGGAAPPVRVTIDCSSHEREHYGRPSLRSRSNSNSKFNVHSFCDLIHGAIPKAIKDGRFILREPEDQTGFSDTLTPISAPPPEGFIPKFSLPIFRVPKLRVPKIDVPSLDVYEDSPFSVPKVGSPFSFSKFKSSGEEDSNIERMEKFKKGVQKMLHVVKVLGQIDQYLSERTRILIDKLAKTFAD